ncbi:MAG TPA: CatB-related O-acetyltransferase [Phenylobacterium sp.]|uniref:CatB-related O-acetyltransferase n=1 Tax=Phenylobacterium sp. TaxID=1871053 RepID=UPI002B45ED9D|nr:CatB-related O-acetyltransferase [Phenylobacterium sp.]HKR88810.1 CatB-related O-acetyltransferase [Phenylobacterium sp.]
MILEITKAILDLLRAHRIALHPFGAERWRIGQRVYINPDCELEPYCEIFAGAVIPARMGAFSYTGSPMLPNTRIGRYCSIGVDVEFIQSTHPSEWVSTASAFFTPRGHDGLMNYLRDRGVERYESRRFADRTGPVTIGHDVWIGQGAMFTKGVTVGNGSVVAARAVVTRDVEPYTIVAGSPARIIRNRFGDGIASRLEASQWWRSGPDALSAYDMRNPEAFLRQIEASPPEQMAPASPLTGEMILAA